MILPRIVIVGDSDVRIVMVGDADSYDTDRVGGDS